MNFFHIKLPPKIIGQLSVFIPFVMCSQGRSALWDAIILLCYRIKVAHGGVLRGISLGSPAYNLLSVLEPTTLGSPMN